MILVDSWGNWVGIGAIIEMKAQDGVTFLVRKNEKFRFTYFRLEVALSLIGSDILCQLAI
jgi:hypothetical protein